MVRRISALFSLVFALSFLKRAHLSRCTSLSQFCAVDLPLLYHQQIGAGKQNIQSIEIFCNALVPYLAKMKLVF